MVLLRFYFREEGEWWLGDYVFTHILNFSNHFNFLRSHVLSYSETRKATLFMLDTKFHFACNESNLYQNLVKFQNIMVSIAWKLFFGSVNFQESCHLAEKR